MKNYNTKFPKEIDDRIFFQDVSISQVPIMQNYYTLLNDENYTRASEYLNNSEVFFYGAWLLNLLESRLYAVGDYLMKEEKPKLTTYQNEELTENLKPNMIWIQ